jgi:hypothetical protein
LPCPEKIFGGGKLMYDDFKVGNVVFSPNSVHASAGLSPNPLEYAQKGTLEELAALKKVLREAGEVVKAVNKYGIEVPHGKNGELADKIAAIMYKADVLLSEIERLVREG